MTQRRHASGGGGDRGAVAYRRCSTDEQSRSGLGIDAQAEAIRALAARLGLTVTAWFDDLGISGGKPLEERPALLAALDELRKGEVLLIAKRDRLGRSVLNVAMIERLVERRGCRVVSAAGEGSDDDAPTSRLMRQIVDAFAEYERAVIRQRTRAALAAKRARGERSGEIPYGYALAPDGLQLEPDPLEQRALRRMRDLRAEGLTCRQIADQMHAEGITTRRGTRWRFQYVAERLRR
jgi:DNA invertase Pin-like site-specific DNA recombinase